MNPLSTHTFRSNIQPGETRNPELCHQFRSLDDHSAILRKASSSSGFSESDHIDRDEEAFPLDDVTPVQAPRNQQQRSVSGLYKVQSPDAKGKTSYYRSYQSMAGLQQHRTYFKFEGAKLLCTKLAGIVARRTEPCFEVRSY